MRERYDQGRREYFCSVKVVQIDIRFSEGTCWSEEAEASSLGEVFESGKFYF